MLIDGDKVGAGMSWSSDGEAGGQVVVVKVVMSPCSISRARRWSCEEMIARDWSEELGLSIDEVGEADGSRESVPGRTTEWCAGEAGGRACAGLTMKRRAWEAGHMAERGVGEAGRTVERRREGRLHDAPRQAEQQRRAAPGKAGARRATMKKRRVNSSIQAFI